VVTHVFNVVGNKGGTAEKYKPHFRPYLKGEMGFFDWREK
jgi:hypothetical protein